jgi:hypothetical protein
MLKMKFRCIKDQIINNVLGPGEAGRFRTIGFQRQGKSADEVLDNLRMVQVYFSEGEFSKRGGRLSGPVQHDITFRIDLTVSKAASVDLHVINDTGSSSTAVTLALVALQEASERADDSFDELVNIVYQILMDARNIDMGFDQGVISGRWIDRIQKDQPLPRGEYVVLTGSMFLKLRAVEQVSGDIGIVDGIFDTTIEIDSDEVGKGGVTV